MHVVLAAGVLGDLTTLGNNLKALGINVVLPLMGLYFVIWTWGKTKSVVAALVACIAAGAIWWGVSNMATLRDKTGQDINNPTSASAPLAVTKAGAK